MSVVATYAVEGMTCGGCAKRVRNAVDVAIPGVEVIEIDPKSGRMRLGSDAPLPEETVRGAVESSGYRFAGTLA
ncbi:heavy metal-associated domain-containing protein [Sphaerisporangium sp. NPDC005288]|uniref:heavy-metal-associated domain-containing protein n=1 Tax=Sphaerisporangium sp. NPDC005288 TaxID=3155114 RepID=UPI00339E8E62